MGKPTESAVDNIYVDVDESSTSGRSEVATGRMKRHQEDGKPKTLPSLATALSGAMSGIIIGAFLQVGLPRGS